MVPATKENAGRRSKSATRNGVLFTVLLLCVLVAHQAFRPMDFSKKWVQVVTSSTTDAYYQRYTDYDSDYAPGLTEDYVMKHLNELGYDVSYKEPEKETSSGCNIWYKTETTNSTIHRKLEEYRHELVDYNEKLRAFEGTVKDIRDHLDEPEDVCDSLKLHEDGLEALFPSGSLSNMSSSSGFVEPLLPPMRSPEICYKLRKNLMSMDFLVHDFAGLCRRLKPRSRTIFIDMGASLVFHGNNQPVVNVLQQFNKFGFQFDHIYAYEITPQEPATVFDKIPKELQAPYHWINVGVSPDVTSPLNPWNLLRDNYNKDDFVVVKLDIDTASVELPLAHQLLEDESLWELVDVFYFEHHIGLTELKNNWGKSMSGSMKESLQLFYALRTKGIAAHSWV